MADDRCVKCGAKCCTYFCFEIDEPDDVDQFEDVRWYLCHENVSVHIDEGSWYISLMNPCTFLDPKTKLCGGYENRPLICRKYDHENCDFTQGDYGYDEEFTTPDQLEEYARKTIGVNFDRTRTRKRKKLMPKLTPSAKD